MISRYGFAAMVWSSVVFLTIAMADLRADRIAPIQPAPPRQAVALADAVAIGKVESISEKIVKAKSHQPGQSEEVEYRVATIKIQEGFLGAKGLTHVQVAWAANQSVPINPRRGQDSQISLSVDQEGCFFLKQHPSESFYVVSSTADFLNKVDPDFERYTNLTRKCAKALDDPQKGLRSKDASERLVTASVLIARYRQQTFSGPAKEETIDAEESKLILGILAEADWTKTDPESGSNAQTMFYILSPTPQDGWQPPQNIADNNKLIELQKKWVKDNVGTYRVKRLVPEKKEK